MSRGRDADASTLLTAEQHGDVVDEGWHALILHTAEYAQMCEQIGGFVHHYPERPDPDRELVSVAAGCRHSDDGGPIVTQPKPKG